MTPPLTPASVDQLARLSAEEYRLPVDQMKRMIEACERNETDAAVSQEPEHFQS